MAEWQSRPLDAVYPVVFIDAIHVKVRDGAAANRPLYVALAVTAEGRREILGLWAGDGGEGAKHWLAKLLKPVYTAPTEEAALDRFAEFAEAWGRKYPAIVKLWENAWEEFIPFPRFHTEIRRIVCTTDAIESVNAPIGRAVKARGHFPNEQAALKCVYMAILSLDPTGKGQARWTMRWKAALNAFDITFDGRLSAARQ